MAQPQVTIGIPTWQAEPFIDKTIGYARNQTYPDIRILVAVDRSDDRTADICRRHASEDGRVQVVVHRERLGWAANANTLLDAMDSEYFFLYPHDDILDRTYTERLLGALRRRPDAASAQCDVLSVGPSGAQYISRGRTHEGTVSERIIASLVAARHGAPLRSLIRREACGAGVRFPPTSRLGFNAHVAFQLELFAAGPSLHLPAILYWRPHERRGGLTDSWAKRTVSVADVVSDQRANAAQCLRRIDACDVPVVEHTLMRFAVYVRLLTDVRSFESRRRTASLVEPQVISAAFDFRGIPSAVHDQPREIQEWLTAAYVNLVRKESLHHLRRGDMRTATAVWGRVTLGQAVRSAHPLARRRLQRIVQRMHPTTIPDDLRERLG